MHFADKALIAETTAKMLLEVKAVLFFSDKPFIFTSGWASPVYIDCRKLIFYPRIRTQLVDFATGVLARDVGFEQFDVVAGGETAGIPYAAWIAERLGLPMQYVRKKPKGFGRNAQIEGDVAKARARCWSRTSPPTGARRSISARRCATPARSSITCSSISTTTSFPSRRRSSAT